MNTIPGRNLALATQFGSYDAADKMAACIQADDMEWKYGVFKHYRNYYVTVNDPEENLFLGYL